MEFSDFISKQERIYSEFRDTTKVEADGLAPKMTNYEGGYVIALRHSKEITDVIGELSENVGEIVHSIKYTQENIHTTIATFEVSNSFLPEDETLKSLINIVNKNISLIKGIKIDYKEWLLNQDSGIAAGKPNVQFFEAVRNIIEYARQNSIELKFPWGAHITVNRFLKKVPKEEMLKLINLFKCSKPLGISMPHCIDVGYFELTSEKFCFNTYERFKI